MKNKISLWSMHQAAFKDFRELYDSTFIICLLPGIIYGLLRLVCEFSYETMLPHLIFVEVIVSLVSVILFAKAFLDVVYDRKQSLFIQPLFFVQACLMQLILFGLHYGAISFVQKDVSYVFGLYLQAAGHETERQIFFFVFLALLYLLMRLQFGMISILEHHYNVLQAMHRSWLLTAHNNWLVEQLFLWNVGIQVLWILFVRTSQNNADFAMMSISFFSMFIIAIQVRIFKELEKEQA